MRENKQNKSRSWRSAGQGSVLLLVIYIVAMLSLAFAITKDMLKETVGMLPMCIAGMTAAWCGGKWTLKKMEPNKVYLYAIAPAVFFCLIYIVFGAWMCAGDIQLQQTIAFLLCVLSGGVLSVMTTGQKKRKGKRVRKR